MTKSTHQSWQNRIVGHGEAAPARLIPNPRNWRLHPKAQREALAGALAEVGWVTQVIVNRRTGHLVDGHARVELALERREPAVPVVYVDLSPEEEAVVLASLDPLSAMADTDPQKLDALLREVSVQDEALRQMLKEWRPDVGAEVPEDRGPQMEKAAELQVQWSTTAGQLWEIPSQTVPGRSHRLLCGDSTDPADVQRLMGEDRAGLLATDPPYGVSLGVKTSRSATGTKSGRHFSKIVSDDLTGERLQRFLARVFGVAGDVALTPSAAWYVWHASANVEAFLAALREVGVNIHQQVIWTKPHFALGRAEYHWQHEPCLFGWAKEHRPPFYGERNQSTLWPTDVGGGVIRREQAHPTEKPVELFSRPIVNHLQRGEIAYEPFAGSGSQLVAGEQKGRLVYGIEIEPKYVAVVLERMKDLGLEPTLSTDAHARKAA